MDRYFRSQAGQDMRRRIASCFVLAGDDGVAAAYHTLASTAVALTDLPTGVSKRLPRYPLVPATLLGRLAVDRRWRGRRLGERMLLDALGRALSSEIATFAVIVDAKDDAAAAFYAAYDFLPLTTAGRRMFIPMTEVARLLAG